MNITLESEMYVHLLHFILTNLSYPGTMSFVQDTYDWIDSVTLSIGSERFSYGV
jgi:hypothetical protein